MFLNFLSDDSERKAGFTLQYYTGRHNSNVSFSVRFIVMCTNKSAIRHLIS